VGLGSFVRVGTLVWSLSHPSRVSRKTVCVSTSELGWGDNAIESKRRAKEDVAKGYKKKI